MTSKQENVRNVLLRRGAGVARNKVVAEVSNVEVGGSPPTSPFCPFLLGCCLLVLSF